MDGPTFDELTKALRSGATRRQAAAGLLGLGVTALTGRGLTDAKGKRHGQHKGKGKRQADGPGGKGGNSACAHFCAAVFGADTPAAGQCTSDAAHGNGLCHACGAANADQVCCVKSNGVCPDYTAAACCTGQDTCGGGNPGTPGVCGHCAPDCTGKCGGADNGCGGKCPGVAGSCPDCQTCSSDGQKCQTADDGTPCGGDGSGLRCCKGVCPGPSSCVPSGMCCPHGTQDDCQAECCAGIGLGHAECEGLNADDIICFPSRAGGRCHFDVDCLVPEQPAGQCICGTCCSSSGGLCFQDGDCCQGTCDLENSVCTP